MGYEPADVAGAPGIRDVCLISNANSLRVCVVATCLAIEIWVSRVVFLLILRVGFRDVYTPKNLYTEVARCING